jgi:hypothetical protein
MTGKNLLKSLETFSDSTHYDIIYLGLKNSFGIEPVDIEYKSFTYEILGSSILVEYSCAIICFKNAIGDFCADIKIIIDGSHISASIH